MSDFDDGTADHVVERDGGRVRLPNWPRLMGVSLAAAYFGICPARFRMIGIRPLRIGRRVLWDRNDLDRFIDDMTGKPVTPRSAGASAKAMERRFFERLKNETEAAAAGNRRKA